MRLAVRDLRQTRWLLQKIGRRRKTSLLEAHFWLIEDAEACAYYLDFEGLKIGLAKSEIGK
jgi:hypothetical protein